MAKHIINNAQVTLTTADLSARVKKVSLITSQRSAQDATAMGDTWEDKLLVPIRAWKGSIEMFQDYAAGSVYATLKTLLDGTTTSTGLVITVRPTTEIRSATNPEFYGSIIPDGDFAQIDAEVGGVNMVSFGFIGDGTLNFYTSSS